MLMKVLQKLFNAFSTHRGGNTKYENHPKVPRTVNCGVTICIYVVCGMTLYGIRYINHTVAHKIIISCG